MSLIKKFKNKPYHSQAVLLVFAALAVFVGGFFVAYFMLGARFPWAASVWKKAAAVLPLPAASIQGQDIRLTMFEVATSLGAPDPTDFVVRRMAVKVLAEDRGLIVTAGELSEREQVMLAAMNTTKDDLITALNDRGVSYADFQRLFIETDILREKLAAAVNVKSDKVIQVENQLRSGTDFSSVATRFSEDLFSSPLGGDIGFVSKDEIDAAVWQRALDLDEDEWDGPISTLEGFVFVKKLEEQPATDDLPHRLRLQFILIEGSDFERWLDEQINQMDVKIFI